MSTSVPIAEIGGGAQLVVSEKDGRFNYTPKDLEQVVEPSEIRVVKKPRKHKKAATTNDKKRVTKTTLQRLSYFTSALNFVGIIILIICISTHGWLEEDSSGCKFSLLHYDCPKYNRSGKLQDTCKDVSDGVFTLLLLAIFGLIGAFWISARVVIFKLKVFSRTSSLVGFLLSFSSWAFMLGAWSIYAAIASQECLRNYAKENQISSRYLSYSFGFVVTLWILYIPLPSFFIWIVKRHGLNAKTFRVKKSKKKKTRSLESSSQATAYLDNESKEYNADDASADGGSADGRMLALVE